MTTTPSCVALIPARAGSKRVPGKNVRELAGHPLLAYTIAAARESGGVFHVAVATDSGEYEAVAERYGAATCPRPPSGDAEPDYAWLSVVMAGVQVDCFAILRPTSPFRTADTIRRAWAQWLAQGERFDSLRAVELCRQHPGKMWELGEEGRIYPALVGYPVIAGQPAHSRPYQTLPAVYVQNASLEIAWTRVLTEHHNISGERVLAFLTKGREGTDINTPDDWALAEHLIATGQATLPEVHLGS